MEKTCKEKRCEPARNWRATDPQKHRDANRKWQAANPEKVREIKRRWEDANPEKRREYRRRWRDAHPEKQREYSRKRYASNPEKQKEAHQKWRATHPEKTRETDRKRYAADSARLLEYKQKWNAAHPNPERTREKDLRCRYGITASDFNAMTLAQNGQCAICGDGNKLVVDHDHANGKVRGLLCGHCNRMLGGARDNPATLQAAIDYLGYPKCVAEISPINPGPHDLRASERALDGNAPSSNPNPTNSGPAAHGSGGAPARKED